MKNIINEHIKPKELGEFREFIASLLSHEGKFLLRNDILIEYDKFQKNENSNQASLKKNSVYEFLNRIQEIFVIDGWIAVMRRYSIAKQNLYLLSGDGGFMEEIRIRRYLELKDRFILGEVGVEAPLHIDFMPFYDYAPIMRDARTIGGGIRFLSRYMCSKNFQNRSEWDEKLFNYIKLHKHGDQQLLVNGGILRDFDSFMRELEKMMDYLSSRNSDEPYSGFELKMKKAGFEPGWGNTAGKVRTAMRMLVNLINEPTDDQFENFINRVPMPLISKIAIISPHGWFGQENVLGRPDTGGQVIYILDQVRALERHIKKEIEEAGFQ